MLQSERAAPARPSMEDVAAAAGVSKAAVSKVIRNAYGVSPAMRGRVESAIEALGYRPRLAARVMRGASFTLGFEIPQLGNDFFTQVMQGAASRLEGSGFQLIIAPALGDMKGAPILDSLVDRQVDGIIAISPEVEPESLEQLGLQVPLVLLGRHDQSTNYDTLTNDDAAGAAMAMHHLLALGHERIAHITIEGHPSAPGDLLPHAVRLHTYEAAMHQRGFEPLVVYSGPLEPEAHAATLRLLDSRPLPTAIFAANDTLAIGALRARAELGLRAEDLSVIGYDNIDLAANPLISLTTIDQFGARSGERAVGLLLERIRDGRRTAEHHVMQPKLRHRASTARRLHSDMDRSGR